MRDHGDEFVLGATRRFGAFPRGALAGEQNPTLLFGADPFSNIAGDF